MGKRLVYAAQSNRGDSPLSITELACAGAFSAVPATLVAGPAERVKVLLQVCSDRAVTITAQHMSKKQRTDIQVSGQGGNASYSGPLDVVRKLYAEGGMKSIFRGTGATLARDGPGSAVWVLSLFTPASPPLSPMAESRLGVLDVEDEAGDRPHTDI